MAAPTVHVQTNLSLADGAKLDALVAALGGNQSKVLRRIILATLDKVTPEQLEVIRTKQKAIQISHDDSKIAAVL